VSTAIPVTQWNHFLPDVKESLDDIANDDIFSIAQIDTQLPTAAFPRLPHDFSATAR
jgi:hypothetical protein